MSGRTKNLERLFPPITRLTLTEQVGPSTARQQWQTITDPTPLEERPGVDVENIQRRLLLLLDLCKCKPPYGVNEYIFHGNKVVLLDSQRIAAMPAVEGVTAVVRVRGGSRRVSSRDGGFLIRWRHWANIRKSYFIYFRVDLFCELQPQKHVYLMEMYDVMSQISDGTLQPGVNPVWDVCIRGNLVSSIGPNLDTDGQEAA